MLSHAKHVIAVSEASWFAGDLVLYILSYSAFHSPSEYRTTRQFSHTIGALKTPIIEVESSTQSYGAHCGQEVHYFGYRVPFGTQAITSDGQRWQC